MRPRAINLPSVTMTEKPESVCIKISVDADNYDYLRLTLTADEAIRFAHDLLTDAIRANACVERRKWMEKVQVQRPKLQSQSS